MKQRYNIGIIGAGRLGTALGIALNKLGHKIPIVISRKITHAKKAAKMIGPEVSGLAFKNISSVPPCGIIFITTPDDAIAAVSKELAKNISSENKPVAVFHTSGALSSDCLIDLKKKKIAVGSIHPLLSISDPLTGFKSLNKAFYCIEGERKAVRLARQIVSDLSGRVFSINAENKTLYHASAVMACGHFIALFDMATEMLKLCGLNDEDARQALIPLVRSTVDNLSHTNTAQALTGPFARADVETIEKHLKAFNEINLHEILQTYILLGERSLRLAHQNGKDMKALTKIREMLKNLYFPVDDD